MLWPWYSIYSVSKQGLIYPLILQKVLFSAVVIDHILMRWSSFGISSVVKPEPREKNNKKNILKKSKQNKYKKKTRVLAGCRMLWEVWYEVLLPTAAARQIQSLLNILRFIWRCFTVAVVVMSLRAFYDCTLIVEALFYTESYFRIQYVQLYNKCIVWRKLNKCCLKTINLSVRSLNHLLMNTCSDFCHLPVFFTTYTLSLKILFVLVYSEYTANLCLWQVRTMDLSPPTTN